MTVTDPAVTDPAETDDPSETLPTPVVDDDRVARNAAEQIERAELDRQQKNAVDRVADAALAMPGNASVDEFMSMAVQARILSMSGAAPKLIRGNPHIALHIVMIGRDLGISASAAVELIDVINTQQGPRPSLSPQLLNGQIRRLGLGQILKVKSTDDHCVALAVEPGAIYDIRCRRVWPEHVDDCRCTFDKFLGESEFTWSDAQSAFLAGKNCTPREHKKNSEGKCGCNQGYITYPKRMMWWRAAGFAADDFFPEAGLGLYTAEELGAMVDANGRAIDVSSVELPPGYELESGKDGDKGSGRQAGDPLTPEEQEKADLCVLRVAALPEEYRERVKTNWKGMQRLKGIQLANLPADAIALVESMIRGVEQQCKTASQKEGGSWSPETAVAALAAEIHAAFPSEQPPAEPAADGDSEPAAAEGDVSRARDTEPEVTKPDEVIAPKRPTDAEILNSAPELMTKVLQEVQALSARQVDARLKKDFDVTVDGNPETRKRALVILILRAAVTQTEGTPDATD